MGWPLAVSAGLMEQQLARALLVALGYLTAGHLLAMLAVTLAICAAGALVDWQRAIQIGASLLVHRLWCLSAHPAAPSAGAGSHSADAARALVVRHSDRPWRRPYARADLSWAVRARPTWRDITQRARSSMPISAWPLLVSIVHTLAMVVAGGLLAWLVYRYLGLKFVSQSWFNLDALWAMSLVLVGALSLALSTIGMD